MPADLIQTARRLIEWRREIDRYFDPTLFADPARDILLDLFTADGEGRRVSPGECGVIAGVPDTTAIRWVNALEEQGLVVSEPDGTNGGGQSLHLTDAARTAMASYLSSLG